MLTGTLDQTLADMQQDGRKLYHAAVLALAEGQSYDREQIAAALRHGDVSPDQLREDVAFAKRRRDAAHQLQQTDVNADTLETARAELAREQAGFERVQAEANRAVEAARLKLDERESAFQKLRIESQQARGQAANALCRTADPAILRRTAEVQTEIRRAETEASGLRGKIGKKSHWRSEVVRLAELVERGERVSRSGALPTVLKDLEQARVDLQEAQAALARIDNEFVPALQRLETTIAQREEHKQAILDSATDWRKCVLPSERKRGVAAAVAVD